MSKLRLDKYLADMGEGTRQEVKALIRKGSVTVNGETVRKPEQKVDTDSDRVTVEERAVGYVEKEYWMLNKPDGYVSATEDPREKTVLELLPDAMRRDLFPAGRLDKDTEGLLLITNDGGLAHRLLSPRSHVDKVYEARISGTVTEEDIRLFADGLDIGDEKPTLPAKLDILSAGAYSTVRITISEGRYHQIKRMFEAVGKKVTYLKRLSMGSLVLDDALAPGEARRLTAEELQKIGVE